jgi:hypothetical protein
MDGKELAQPKSGLEKNSRPPGVNRNWFNFGGLAVMSSKGCRPMALRRRRSPGLPLSVVFTPS